MTLIKKKKISNITSIFIFTNLILVLILYSNKYKGYLSSSFLKPLLKFPFK